MTTISVNQSWVNANLSSSSYTLATGTIVLITENITISANYGFIINGSNITINGQFNTVTINNVVWSGLISNAATLTNTNIIIKNINVVSSGTTTLALHSGWICKSYFCNGQASFCSSNGAITLSGGGIFGEGCYGCLATNCFSTGQIGDNITNYYAGGIFGACCLNSNATQCYSAGIIGQYCGGIFGCGTNYIWDGSTFTPSSILDQSGSSLIPLLNANNVVSSVSTYPTATACYSIGSIGSYAGGIFGYFAYMSKALNCYSLGNGSTLSGGIFAPNYYFTGSIYTPTGTNCSATYCYTIGTVLSGDGIFAQTGTTNTVFYCKAELNGIWRDCNAKQFLKGIGCTWIDIDICSSHIPYLLKSFNRSLYTCPYQKIKCKHASSSTGIFGPTYQILRVNGHKVPCNISINSATGVMSFDKVKKGAYKIKNINGVKIIINSTSVSSYYVWTNYNISNFILKSKYKCHKKKKCKSSSSSSSSSCKPCKRW